jgi:hypothetical protein
MEAADVPVLCNYSIALGRTRSVDGSAFRGRFPGIPAADYQGRSGRGMASNVAQEQVGQLLGVREGTLMPRIHLM